MGSVLCKLFYTILLLHKSGIVNTVFRFVSFRIAMKEAQKTIYLFDVYLCTRPK